VACAVPARQSRIFIEFIGSSLLFPHEKLEVVKGDVFDAHSITPVLEGKNAVMSCLGFQVGAKTLYSKSITSIIAAAER